MVKNLKEHWEHIYQTKKPTEVSWTQEIPEASLTYVKSFHLLPSARIIDIGGGDSRLADHLLDQGFTDITVLDISESAIQRARQRLGNRADAVKWIVSDILDFSPLETYDLWHDRAVFHFLREPGQIRKYLEMAEAAVRGYLVVGTFSVDGPAKCSGLDVSRYDEEGLKALFRTAGFSDMACSRENHITPSGDVQNFVFCSFSKK